MLLSNKSNLQRIPRELTGFTLAEVLIVLGIVGVIASITLPLIKSEIDDITYSSKIKKVYSTIMQATSFINGNNEAGAITSATELREAYEKYIKYQYSGTMVGSLWASKYKGYKAPNVIMNSIIYDTGRNIITLNTGETIRIESFSPACNAVSSGTGKNTTCGVMQVELNGLKPPNEMGKDYYTFWIDRENNMLKIIPLGQSDGDGYKCISDVDVATFFNRGAGCTALAITDPSLLPNKVVY